VREERSEIEAIRKANKLPDDRTGERAYREAVGPRARVRGYAGGSASGVTFVTPARWVPARAWEGGQRIIRFCKTGESAKSYNAEADDPDWVPARAWEGAGVYL